MKIVQVKRSKAAVRAARSRVSGSCHIATEDSAMGVSGVFSRYTICMDCIKIAGAIAAREEWS